MTNPSTQLEAPNRVRLSDLPKGSPGRVIEISGESTFCQRMRELGLIETEMVAVQDVNGSVLCKIKDSRFGISRDAAENIWVELLH